MADPESVKVQVLMSVNLFEDVVLGQGWSDLHDQLNKEVEKTK